MSAPARLDDGDPRLRTRERHDAQRASQQHAEPEPSSPVRRESLANRQRSRAVANARTSTRCRNDAPHPHRQQRCGQRRAARDSAARQTRSRVDSWRTVDAWLSRWRGARTVALPACWPFVLVLELLRLERDVDLEVRRIALLRRAAGLAVRASSRCPRPRSRWRRRASARTVCTQAQQVFVVERRVLVAHRVLAARRAVRRCRHRRPAPRSRHRGPAAEPCGTWRSRR